MTEEIVNMDRKVLTPTPATIARKLGVARPTFNRLVNGLSNLSPEIAIRLSKVLGSSAQSWLNMQTNYDLYYAERATGLR